MNNISVRDEFRYVAKGRVPKANVLATWYSDVAGRILVSKELFPYTIEFIKCHTHLFSSVFHTCIVQQRHLNSPIVNSD